MAKYCVKCGKALPDGVEICSECNAKAEQASDAALFTRMTAETEVWKESDDQTKKRRRMKMLRNNRQRILLYAGAVLLVALTVFVITFTTPTSRVVRALNGGEYDKALSLYLEKLSDEPERSGRIDKALSKAAEATCAAFAADEISAGDAEKTFAALLGFGGDVETLLADSLAEFDTYKDSRGYIDEGDKLFRKGEYLAAYDSYVLVLESDSRYAYAQEQAAQCLEQYAQSVLTLAGEAILNNDFPAAITALREGNDALAEYGTFSESIDSKLLDCCDLYESYILTEAKNLAELEDYDAAVELILSCTRDFGYETDALLSALETYSGQAGDKKIADAVARAEELYASGDYAAAFAALEGISTDDSARAETVNQAITDMEKRFAADTLAEAETIFGGKRDNAEKAVAALDEALEIRELDALKTRRDELQLLIPASLVDFVYAAKEGDVYRSGSDFEGLDGVTYSDGWIWGEDGAWMSFDLGGNYDRLEGSFITRNKDGKSVTGYFEVWCDGEKVFTSAKLYHWETEAVQVSVDISGCRELKIVFCSNYEVSTAQSGYCYHGFCSPTVIKDFEEE